MRGTVAVIREQGQTFSVVAVKDSVFQSQKAQEDTLYAAQIEFGPRTAILGERESYGPPDIVRWLSGVDPGRLPWREFTLPA